MDRKTSAGMIVRAATVALAIAAAFAPIPAPLVERAYSSSSYLAWQPWVTTASNAVPFAVFDLGFAAVVAGWLAALIVDRGRGRRPWLRVVVRAVVRTVVWGAALYLLFLVAWGLNYRRVPLSGKLRFDASAVTPAAARALATTAIARLDALHDDAHAAAWSDREMRARLADAFAGAERTLGATRLAAPGRPKRTIFDLYFRRAGVSGMTDPYFLETMLAGDLLPFERPFVIAHEWSHLAGYADESEANFVGWIACLRGAAPLEYSAWISLYGDIVRAVPAGDRAALVARLDPGPRADLRAMVERSARHVSPVIATAGWSVYDRYLKANRVEAGTASYAAVVRLMLGTRFGPRWTPELRH
jgi:hypothetical protein